MENFKLYGLEGEFFGRHAYIAGQKEAESDKDRVMIEIYTDKIITLLYAQLESKLENVQNVDLCEELKALETSLLSCTVANTLQGFPLCHRQDLYNSLLRRLNDGNILGHHFLSTSRELTMKDTHLRVKWFKWLWMLNLK